MTNEELAKLIQEGHTEYIEQLWLQVEKFVRMQADKRVRHREQKKLLNDDLYLSGYLALLDAINAIRLLINAVVAANLIGEDIKKKRAGIKAVRKENSNNAIDHRTV